MSSEKVVLPKDVAKAIARLREYTSDGRIVMAAVGGTVINQKLWDECTTLWEYARESEDTLMQALVNGYEIDKSPEDRIREYFRGHKPCAVIDTEEEFHVNIGKRSGVRKTLEILGITIEGVND